jgi:hypothetical protein
MADSQISSAEANLNFDMDDFYNNWVRSMGDVQVWSND